ncbi:MAG: helix-turn-helix domain-containing protein [Spirochaetaceae bacterium]|nr:helix-turn-helix domain-containing protein [Spirochaetaceae bacterium]
MKEQELRQIFSVNVKKHRNRRNWTQAVLAKEIGVSTNFIYDIENCKKWISPLTLAKLAEALEVEVSQLFKPQETLSDERKDLIVKLATDISKTVTQSLEYVRDQYLRD